ncbi:MAG: hypothetical protein AAF723_11240, partial [Pseudomonadota bacterium]
MTTKKRGTHGNIWVPHSIAQLALGYGLAYIFFTLCVRLSDLVSHGPSDQFLEVFPGFTLGFVPIIICTCIFLAQRLSGEERQTLFSAIPVREVFSAVATVGIALSTVLIIGAESISVLLALVLMRAGVLIISPLIDILHNRQVQRASYFALVLSLLAMVVAIGGKQGLSLTQTTMAVLLVYLTSYAVRLTFMVRGAKTPMAGARAVWFIREQVITATIMVILMISLTFVMAFPKGSFLSDHSLIFHHDTVFIGVSYAIVLT